MIKKIVKHGHSEVLLIPSSFIKILCPNKLYSKDVTKLPPVEIHVNSIERFITLEFVEDGVWHL